MTPGGASWRRAARAPSGCSTSVRSRRSPAGAGSGRRSPFPDGLGRRSPPELRRAGRGGRRSRMARSAPPRAALPGHRGGPPHGGRRALPPRSVAATSKLPSGPRSQVRSQPLRHTRYAFRSAATYGWLAPEHPIDDPPCVVGDRIDEVGQRRRRDGRDRSDDDSGHERRRRKHHNILGNILGGDIRCTGIVGGQLVGWPMIGSTPLRRSMPSCVSVLRSCGDWSAR